MIMSYQEFSEELIGSLKMAFDGEMEVRVSSVIKNNDNELDALIFARPDTNIAPTLYVGQYYEEYLEHGSFEKVVDDVIYVVNHAKAPDEYNMEFFKNYDIVKEFICFKLVNKENNIKFLKNAVYENFMDLAMVLFVSFSDIEDELALGEKLSGGFSTVTIKKEHLKLWNVTKKQVVNDAIKNTKRLFKPKFMKLKDALEISYREAYRKFMEEDDFDEFSCISVEEMLEAVPDAPVYVLSNEKGVFGASAMTYDGVLECIAEKCESDLIIIPSSINEVIIIPRTELDTTYLNEIIAQVNANEVDYGEVLSDHAYFYTRGLGISMSEDSEKFYKTKKCSASRTLIY